MGTFGPGEELITAPVDLVVGIATDRSYLSERHATTAPLHTTPNSDTLRVMTRLPRDIVSRRSRTTSVTVLALGPSLWLGCEAVVQPVPGPAVEVQVTPAGASISGVGATATFHVIARNANGVWFPNTVPALMRLRHEPRYQALLERMGLPEEWRQ